MSDITVRLNFGLDTADISLIQGIEKQLDAALQPIGFTRTTTGKGGDFAEFNYRQYAVALTEV
ncbi:MAG: hypothetical protein ACXV2C_07575 [Candidatus Bathyarchaeia archaeon]